MLQRLRISLGLLAAGLLLASAPTSDALAQADTIQYWDFSSQQGWNDTILNGTTNAWVYGTDVPSGDFAIAPINSTTADNGYWLYDSDLYCQSDDARFYSPVLDLTAYDEVEIRWQEQYRQFQGTPFVDVSIDGGQTFTSIDVRYNLAVNAFRDDNPFNNFANLTDIAAGQANVVVGFRYSGACDYAWMVDDVALVDEFTRRPNNDLVLTANFAAGPANFATPVSQVDEDNRLYFVTDVTNNGGATATNVAVAVDVYSTDSIGGPFVDLLYTDTVRYDDIASDATVENNVFAEGFPMPREVGTYVVLYSALSDSTDLDAVPDDNLVFIDFEVTPDTRYERAPTYRTAVRDPNSTDEYELGVIYLTPNLEGLERFAIDSITSGYYAEGFTDNSSDAFVEIVTYGYRGDLNQDNTPDIGPASDPASELVELALNEIILTADNSPEGFSDLFTIQPSLDEGSVELPLDEGYIGYAVSMRYMAAGSGGAGDLFYVAWDNVFSTGAYNLALDTLELGGTMGYVEDEFFRNGFRIAPDADTPEQQANYTVPGGGSLIMDTYITVDSLTSNVVELGSTEVALRPSVASEVTFLDVDLAGETAGTLTVTDFVGKEVLRREEALAGARTIRIDVRDFRQGAYTVTLVTDSGARAVRKLLIAR